MSQTWIPADVRRRVITRARNACEYCRLHEDDTLMGCHVDHIISEKHGGPTTEDNLAYSCASCNRSKGSDVGFVLMFEENAVFLRFFNPRLDPWNDHFALDPTDSITIVAQTDIGRVTARIFGFNHSARLLERSVVFAAGRYPPP